MSTANTARLAIIRGILQEEDPLKRWQDPPIEIRSDVRKPFYYIRPYVPRPGIAGLQRVRKRIPLGYCDEITMRVAQARKQEIMAPINQGKFLLQAQISFKELVEKYNEARLPSLGAATRSKYSTHIQNHILPVFGNVELGNIDRQTVEAWLNREAQPHSHSFQGKQGRAEAREFRGLSWWGVSDLRFIMSGIFTAAIDWGLWSGANPCTRVRLGPPTHRREKRIPTASDLQRFLAALPENRLLPVEGARLVVLTAAIAGLRVSEALGLRVEDIDPRARTLAVRRRWHRGDVSAPKSENSRRVREIGPLAERLLAYAAGKGAGEWIFERFGRPLDDRDLQNQVFRPAAEGVGIYFAGFGMHTFRRLNISWRQEVGATPFEAMKAAGHARPSTTWLYTITDGARERSHVQKIFERIEGTPPAKTRSKREWVQQRTEGFLSPRKPSGNYTFDTVEVTDSSSVRPTISFHYQRESRVHLELKEVAR